MVARRHPAQRAPLCVRRHGADHDAAHAALFRVRPLPRVPLVLVGHRGDADLDGVCLGRERLHAALGPAGAIRHGHQLRVAGLAADLQRHADAQLPLFRPRRQPLLHAAVVHASGPAASGADGDVDSRAARAQGAHHAAQADRRRPAADHAGALAGGPGARPRRRQRPRQGGHQRRTGLVLPGRIPAAYRVAAGPRVGAGDRRFGAARAAALAAAPLRARRQEQVPGGGAWRTGFERRAHGAQGRNHPGRRPARRPDPGL